MKDYYRTLELPPNASSEAVRKAYRRLAKEHHPDKNAGNAFATARFIALQEAYSILSDKTQRQLYDEERWLAGYTHSRQAQAVTPEWLLEQCRRLNRQLAEIDTYRLSPSLLQDFLLQLFSDVHLGILLQAAQPAVNAAILKETLPALGKLPSAYHAAVAEKMLAIADTATANEIQHLMKKKAAEEQWQRQMPWLILAAAIVLCALMLLYGS